MSEKRFTLEQWTEESLYFSDGEYSAHMSIEYICKKVEKKLNEQQATITKLEQICEKKMQEIEDIKYSLKEIAYKYHKEVQFKADTDPNQAVKEVLCEQQDTIRKLQDLCGESDSENAKLRIENKKLQAENEQLKNRLNKEYIKECSMK